MELAAGGALVGFCDAPTPAHSAAWRCALCNGPTRAGRLGKAAGETDGAGEALGGVRRSVLSSPWSVGQAVVASGFGQSVRSVGRPVSVVVPGDHIARTALLEHHYGCRAAGLMEGHRMK
ncbi:hypothetical protein V496_08726 [Pseudogymnoascus sp. VKM F-4515 (FW-2607)]|nr:hypothetical protein V496_08726 [Pseudogymnoascus sp. VKM F-4515 (FW-2607)]